jgi:hypothetical protein
MIIGNQVQILSSPAAVNDGAVFIMPLSQWLGKVNSVLMSKPEDLPHIFRSIPETMASQSMKRIV